MDRTIITHGTDIRTMVGDIGDTATLVGRKLLRNLSFIFENNFTLPVKENHAG